MKIQFDIVLSRGKVQFKIFCYKVTRLPDLYDIVFTWYLYSQYNNIVLMIQPSINVVMHISECYHLQKENFVMLFIVMFYVRYVIYNANKT